MHTARPLHQLLGDSDPLQRLARHVERLKQLDAKVRKHLPAPLRDHCRVANLREQALVLQADSPVWGTLLRYQVPALLERLRTREGLPGLARIQVKTAPQAPACHGPDTPSRRATAPLLPLRMTPRTAALIASLAEGIEDPDLRQSLQRLARHGARKSRNPAS